MVVFAMNNEAVGSPLVFFTFNKYLRSRTHRRLTLDTILPLTLYHRITSFFTLVVMEG